MIPPGNSGDAPGQNKDNDEAELPPGFEAAGDNPADIAKENGNGLGLGKIAPGLAKLFGYDDGTGDNEDFETPEGLPPGLGNIPPGQLKKFDASVSFVYSPDDYFEDPIDDLVEDGFEDKYDKMYKDSKAKEKMVKNNNERLLKEKGNTGGGNPNCDNEGITDGDSTNTSGTVDEDYTVQGFTAIGSNCKDVTGQIKITIDGPLSPPAKYTNESQPFTFQPDETGTWIIQASAAGQFGTRTINVAAAAGGNNPPVADAGNDQSVNENVLVTLDGSGSTDIEDDAVPVALTYAWILNPGPGSATFDASAISPTFTSETINGGGPDRDLVFTLTVTDSQGEEDTSTVTITVINN